MVLGAAEEAHFGLCIGLLEALADFLGKLGLLLGRGRVDLGHEGVTLHLLSLLGSLFYERRLALLVVFW